VIYDTFLFFNELELLELRLHELAGVVDRFVLVETARTHSNRPKPLYFDEQRERFKEFQDKIIHVVVKDTPALENPSLMADFQRNAVGRGLAGCRPEDIIMLSDLDEIPSADKVRATAGKLVFDSRPAADLWHRLLKHPAVIWTFRNFFKKHHPFVWVFEHKYFMYFLNCVRVTTWAWPGTRMVHYRDFSSGYHLRRWRGHVVPDAGWHFSYMGGIDRIQTKLASYSHTERNTPEFNNRERIARAVAEGQNIIAPDVPLRFERIDDSYPAYLRANLSKFSPWIRPLEAGG